MRKQVLCFSLLSLMLAVIVSTGSATERQPGADYHARREALAKKIGGPVVLFAGVENEGPNDIYGFRQEDDYYYLSGMAEPGSALLIAPAADPKGDAPARPYTEILFLPARNLTQEQWTGPKLGAENPDAAKVTGFDRVEEMGKLPAARLPQAHQWISIVPGYKARDLLVAHDQGCRRGDSHS